MNLIFLAILFISTSNHIAAYFLANYGRVGTKLKGSYLDELSLVNGGSKKCLVALTTDAWNIGQRKYKEYLAVYKMAKKIQKNNIACVELPLWELSQGPHYDDLQRLFESFWIPDMTNTESLLLQFDLVIIPDPVIAKYMLESYFEKEAKITKRKAYYDKLVKQPWGVVEHYPPKERYEYERIRDLSKQRSIRKFPPIATCGDEAYRRIKQHGQVEYFSYGVEDFALYLPPAMVPTRRVLLLRFKNRYEALAQSLVLRGINVTSAYPVTWMKKHWSPQEDRLAGEVDVVYFHEPHVAREWMERMSVPGAVGSRTTATADTAANSRNMYHIPVAACHDEKTARVAKSVGFQDVFYAKKRDTEGLTKTVMQAVDYAKTLMIERSGQKPLSTSNGGTLSPSSSFNPK